jgi:hypothetical protein
MRRFDRRRANLTGRSVHHVRDPARRKSGGIEMFPQRICFARKATLISSERHGMRQHDADTCASAAEDTP